MPQLCSTFRGYLLLLRLCHFLAQIRPGALEFADEARPGTLCFLVELRAKAAFTSFARGMQFRDELAARVIELRQTQRDLEDAVGGNMKIADRIDADAPIERVLVILLHRDGRTV